MLDRRVFSLLAAVALCGCESRFFDVYVRPHGAMDLKCPSGDVGGYNAGGNVWVARGCGRWVSYDCNPYTGVCIPHVAAAAHVDPTPQPGP